MSDRIFFHEILEGAITKMTPTITDNCPGVTKSRKDVFFNKFDNRVTIIRSGWNRLYPFGDIIYSKQNV